MRNRRDPTRSVRNASRFTSSAAAPGVSWDIWQKITLQSRRFTRYLTIWLSIPVCLALPQTHPTRPSAARRLDLSGPAPKSLSSNGKINQRANNKQTRVKQRLVPRSRDHCKKGKHEHQCNDDCAG